MIIDINASLGHYPFRSLRPKDAAGLVQLMDRNGIDRAVVTSLPALFYRDAHRGNEEMFAETQRYPGRLLPVVTVNPNFPGWERDLAQAVEEWKMRIVTLAPEYHGYALTDGRGQAALAQIDRYGLPLMLVQRFEDRRQRHAFDRAEDLTNDAMLHVAKAFPRMKFLLVNWLFLDGPRMVAAGLKGRCLIDFARMQVIFRKELPRLMASLGPEAFAFGSHMPFEYVAPSLVKLADVQLFHAASYEKIAWQNAVRFLGLQ